MAEAIIDRFIEALQRLERDRDIGSIVSCFAADAEMGGAAAPHDSQGGVENYWRIYREAFGEVGSRFRNVITSEGRAALEWTTDGTSRFGDPIGYSGVSVIEHDGQRITRFHAYFDPAVFGSQKHGRIKDPVILHRESEDLVREVP